LPRASLQVRSRRQSCACLSAVLRLVSSFAGGVLLAAVAFELVPDADERAGLWMTAVGLLAGTLIYVGADTWLSRNEAIKAMRPLGSRCGRGSPAGAVPRNSGAGTRRDDRCRARRRRCPRVDRARPDRRGGRALSELWATTSPWREVVIRNRAIVRWCDAVMKIELVPRHTWSWRQCEDSSRGRVALASTFMASVDVEHDLGSECVRITRRR
jgi:hypothetical protein